MNGERPRVTICVPAYRASSFIARTLESARAQTWPCRIVVSVDAAGADDTAATVRKAVPGSAEIIEQPRRLGWIGNVNAATRLARTAYAMVLPHDDVLEPDYVERCMEALLGMPDAALAFTDLDFIESDSAPVMSEASETGPATERIGAIVRGHFDAVAFRGVFRRRFRHRVPASLGGYAADTLWVAQAAAQGPIVRVPGVSYHKHVLESSTHRRWNPATPEERDEMWLVHCTELLATIARVRPTALLRAGIREAMRARLLRQSIGPPGPPGLLRPDRPLLPQMLRVYRRVRRRRPHYSWMAG